MDEQEHNDNEQQDATPSMPIKALPGGRIAHYAVLWGDAARKDLTGEWFTPKTEELTAIFSAVGKLPLMYDHGTNAQVKAAPIGLVDMMGVDDVGLWYQAQLDLANQYTTAVQHLIGETKLGTSSGALPAGRKALPTGELVRWPIVELTLTPRPAEYRMMERPIEQIKAAYKAVNLELPTSNQGAEEARQREVEIEIERLRLLDLTDCTTE